MPLRLSPEEKELREWAKWLARIAGFYQPRARRQPGAPEFPIRLESAADVAGALRQLADTMTGEMAFPFATVERLIREIMIDYPDPYEVACVLLTAAKRHELDLVGEVWNTLDVRAYARLRAWYWMPEGMGRYAYLMDFVAGASLRAQCYPWFAAWEDAADDTRVIAEARVELDKLLEAFLGRPAAN